MRTARLRFLSALGWIFSISTFLILTACPSGPQLIPPTVDSPTPDPAGYSYYPKSGEPFLQQLSDLVGTLLVIVPTPNKPGEQDVHILGRALTADGLAQIKTTDEGNQKPIYSSIVTGKFASTFSAVLVGELDLSGDAAYNFTLTKVTSTVIPPDLKYLDQTKFDQMKLGIPNEYTDIVWVVGIENRMLDYTTFTEASSAVKAGVAAMSIGSSLYYSDARVNTQTLLVYTGISQAGAFGTIDPKTGLYALKPTAELATVKPTPPPPSSSTTKKPLVNISSKALHFKLTY